MASLYAHIPFCQKKCFYCSFVVSIAQEKRMAEYVDCLKREMWFYKNEKIQTLYLGGGTPSSLPEGEIERLYRSIKEIFSLQSLKEVTLEANPEGLTLEKLRLFKNLGVNRVSLGVQTLNDRYLKFLGRVHDRKKAIEAFGLMRSAGFENINVDIIFGLPNQTLEELTQDVEEICRLQSEHISIYALSIEPNSRFFAQQVVLAGDDEQKAQYETVLQLLKDNGFEQYEVSNFAKPGRRSLHNMNYWQGGEYTGVGIGAHSYRNGQRSWNIPKLTDYIQKIKSGQSVVEGRENLKKDQQLIETLLFGLRMNDGVDLNQLQETFGLEIDAGKNRTLDHLIENQFLEKSATRLKVTDKGRLVLDEICARLI